MPFVMSLLQFLYNIFFNGIGKLLIIENFTNEILKINYCLGKTKKNNFPKIFLKPILFPFLLSTVLQQPEEKSL